MGVASLPSWSTPPACWRGWPLRQATMSWPGVDSSGRGSLSPTAKPCRDRRWRWQRPKVTPNGCDSEWLDCQRRIDELDPGSSPSARTETLYGELSSRVLVDATGPALGDGD